MITITAIAAAGGGGISEVLASISLLLVIRLSGVEGVMVWVEMVLGVVVSIVVVVSVVVASVVVWVVVVVVWVVVSDVVVSQTEMIN